ncbi:MAG: glutamate synthase subunit beta [bacterium]|nr:glutamate synthase subunit beta [bacterium]
MAKDPKGFLNITRKISEYRPVCDRIRDNKEVIDPRSDASSMEQAKRCMDCGTPFCHSGCPIGNIIPEWNELLAAGHWEAAFLLLDATNILPEVTGRICPALCEASCVIAINDDAVTIRENELGIIEHAFNSVLIKPHPPQVRTGKHVAVVGSGPAGISVAAFLNRKGYSVTVFERDANLGGILRYGIPDFKLEKTLLERRIELLKEEGIQFKVNTNITDIDSLKKEQDFDAVCLAIGSRTPRDLVVPGRELDGIHFAMDFLIQHNKKVTAESFNEPDITALNKNVVVIGGGDTGADCIGVSHRQGASCVTQIEIMPKPPEDRTPEMAWPKFPMILRVSSSHQEGGERDWCVMTKKFLATENKKVRAIQCERVEFGPEKDSNGRAIMKVVENSEFEIPTDLVVLAMGFVHPEHEGLIKNTGLELDQRGNIKAAEKNPTTSIEGVFVAGDARRGASLIVWAIYEAQNAAAAIDEYLS